MTPSQLYYTFQLFNIDFSTHEIDIRFNVGLGYGDESIDHFSAYCAGGEL